jgi:hypothetical protein
MNASLLNDLVQLVGKHFQKNFYRDDDELCDVQFLIVEEAFDKVEYVNALIPDLTKEIDYSKESNSLLNKSEKNLLILKFSDKFSMF